MEIFADPTLGLGLLTLIVLELILGIDNLIFIAILADKLPPHQRDRARLIGLSLALMLRLGLLAGMSYLVTLTAPLFSVFERGFSGRDLILAGGGVFLLFKATMELHERLEGGAQRHEGPKAHAAFGIVITQIVVLDAVFSLDAVITAVGMVEQLWVMMTAVVIAMAAMMLASKPLTHFVNERPTVVVLCLGFLLMIGFSLIAEGFGLHIPKGYLYAAIGFSVLIEFFNQVARRNRAKQAMKRPLRERTADAVLHLLGGRIEAETPLPVIAAGAEAVFAPTERQMIRSVLELSQRGVESIMTQRRDIVWLDLNRGKEALVESVKAAPHTRLPVARGALDAFEGVVQSRDLLRNLLEQRELDIERAITQPLAVQEGASALRVLEQLRHHPVPLAIVVDEYGSIEGLVTVNDILAAIAGDFVDTANTDALPQPIGEGAWLVPGAFPIKELDRLLGTTLPYDGEYRTLAGLLLDRLGRIPAVGESLQWQGHRFEIRELDGLRIARVWIQKAETRPTEKVP
ncbi:MAG: TerC family protein [Nitrococcus mobilis]|nr:TerC family protein [Nitrococcus mobilis]